MAEHSTVNRRVVGSSPTWGVFYYKNKYYIYVNIVDMKKILNRLYNSFISNVYDEVVKSPVRILPVTFVVRRVVRFCQFDYFIF